MWLTVKLYKDGMIHLTENKENKVHFFLIFMDREKITKSNVLHNKATESIKNLLDEVLNMGAGFQPGPKTPGLAALASSVPFGFIKFDQLIADISELPLLYKLGTGINIIGTLLLILIAS
ncbi:hypothetical protein KSF78_0001090 [Schistosoma japonicum]|nr:hypothetical protein KSF78_0001090 [Schistosoma japonicum]